MDTKAYTKRLFITYTVFGILAICMSTIGLIWSNWEILACVSVGIGFGIVNYYFLISFSYRVSGDNKSSLASFMSGYGLRFLLQIIGLGVSVLIIFLTKEESDSTYRYFNILGTGIGFILPAIVSAIINPDKFKKKEESK
ncbi:MAG: hypothetical protein WCR63_03415 [Bacilli bacterium]